MTQTLTGKEVFRAAYENRYTWDQDFPGYMADVVYNNGDSTYRGQVTIKPDLSFEVSGVADESAKKAINSQLWEMTIHRINHSFEKTHGENTFTVGKTDDTGAVEILVGGAGAGNSYKVRDNTVCFVNRKIGSKIVNINTSKTLMTETGYLAQEYDSVYLDPATGEPQGGKTNFEDSFEKVGDYYLLNRRCFQAVQAGESRVSEFVFSNFKLLN